jgi:hypothetical protein
MKPKTRNLLITGVALAIFGPVLGWVLALAGIFHTEQSVIQTTPGTMPDMQRTASQLFMSLIPLGVGAVCGATGLFLILYVLITHFFRPKTDV